MRFSVRDRHARECARRELRAPSSMRTTPSISGASAAERADRDAVGHLVDEHGERAADLAGEPRRADARLRRHEARAPVFSDVGGNRVGQRIRCRAIDRRVREAADAIEIAPRRGTRAVRRTRRRSRPGKPTMNVLRIVRSGRARRHAVSRSSTFSGAAGRFISLRMRGLACWNGTSRYGEKPGLAAAVAHQRDHVVDVRVRVDVVQPHPRAVLARQSGELARELVHPRLDRASAPEAGAVAHVDAVRARVLRHHQQLLDARLRAAARPRAAPRRSAG